MAVKRHLASATASSGTSTPTGSLTGCVQCVGFTSLHNSAVDTDVTELQQRSIESIRGAVRERAVGERAHLFLTHEAVRALLHGGLGTIPWTRPMVAWPLYDPPRLSVPDSAVDSVSLAHLLRDNLRGMLSIVSANGPNSC